MRLSLKNKRFTSFFTPLYLASLKVVNHRREKWVTFKDKIAKYYWKNWHLSVTSRKWRKQKRLTRFVRWHYSKQKRRRRGCLQKFKIKRRLFILRSGLKRRDMREWFFLSRYNRLKSRKFEVLRINKIRKRKKIRNKKFNKERFLFGQRWIIKYRKFYRTFLIKKNKWYEINKETKKLRVNINNNVLLKIKLKTKIFLLIKTMFLLLLNSFSFCSLLKSKLSYFLDHFYVYETSKFLNYCFINSFKILIENFTYESFLFFNTHAIKDKFMLFTSFLLKKYSNKTKFSERLNLKIKQRFSSIYIKKYFKFKKLFKKFKIKNFRFYRRSKFRIWSKCNFSNYKKFFLKGNRDKNLYKFNNIKIFKNLIIRYRKKENKLFKKNLTYRKRSYIKKNKRKFYKNLKNWKNKKNKKLKSSKMKKTRKTYASKTKQKFILKKRCKRQYRKIKWQNKLNKIGLINSYPKRLFKINNNFTRNFSLFYLFFKIYKKSLKNWRIKKAFFIFYNNFMKNFILNYLVNFFSLIVKEKTLHFSKFLNTFSIFSSISFSPNLLIKNFIFLECSKYKLFLCQRHLLFFAGKLSKKRKKQKFPYSFTKKSKKIFGLLFKVVRKQFKFLHVSSITVNNIFTNSFKKSFFFNCLRNKNYKIYKKKSIFRRKYNEKYIRIRKQIIKYIKRKRVYKRTIYIKRFKKRYIRYNIPKKIDYNFKQSNNNLNELTNFFQNKIQLKKDNNNFFSIKKYIERLKYYHYKKEKRARGQHLYQWINNTKHLSVNKLEKKNKYSNIKSKKNSTKFINFDIDSKIKRFKKKFYKSHRVFRRGNYKIKRKFRKRYSSYILKKAIPFDPWDIQRHNIKRLRFYKNKKWRRRKLMWKYKKHCFAHKISSNRIRTKLKDFMKLPKARKKRYTLYLRKKRLLSSFFDEQYKIPANEYILPKKKSNRIDFFRACLVKPLYRIDILLWHLQFTDTVTEAQNRINYNNVFVNNKLVKSNYFLTKGDTVVINLEQFPDVIEVQDQKYPIKKALTFPFISFDKYTGTFVIVKSLDEITYKDIVNIYNRMWDRISTLRHFIIT